MKEKKKGLVRDTSLWSEEIQIGRIQVYSRALEGQSHVEGDQGAVWGGGVGGGVGLGCGVGVGGVVGKEKNVQRSGRVRARLQVFRL